jgi:IS5 family transposase
LGRLACSGRTALPEDGPARSPAETTILKFRHLLEKHGLTAKMMNIINDSLAERGLLLKGGTMVDATIIHAPPSTKNEQKQRDPEMHQTKREPVVLRDESPRGR